MKRIVFAVLCCGLMLALLLCACKKEENATQPEPNTLTYEQYIAMDGKSQQAFMESFDSVEAFVEWYNAVQKAYFDSLPQVPTGSDGVN